MLNCDTRSVYRSVLFSEVNTVGASDNTAEYQEGTCSSHV
jgi:hypothetical protein